MFFTGRGQRLTVGGFHRADRGAGTGADWSYYRRDYSAQVGFGRPVAAGGTGWFAFLRAFNASGGADQHKPDSIRHLGRATYGLSDVYLRTDQHGWATGFNNVTNTLVCHAHDGAEARPLEDQRSLGLRHLPLHRPSRRQGTGEISGPWAPAGYVRQSDRA